MSTLVVWLGATRVGKLTRKDNGNLRFRYDEGYTGPVISQALPLQREAHPHATTRAVFGGLLPEGDVRVALARNLGISETNDYLMLSEVGGDVAGAITLYNAHHQARTGAVSRTRRQRGVLHGAGSCL